MMTIENLSVVTEDTESVRADEHNVEAVRELSLLELSLVGGGTGIVQFR